MYRYPFFILIIFSLFTSCVTHHKTISGISSWSYPLKQEDEQFSFSYVDQVLDKTGNQRAARWAKRKNIHVISVRIINNGKKPVHGMQLSFYNGDEPVERMHNAWLARKVRQRISPLMILFVPVWIVEEVIKAKLDEDEDDYCEPPFEEQTPNLTAKVASEVDKQRENANLDLQEELMNFQLEKQVLWPGKPVYGVLGIRSKKELEQLRVVKHDVDFEVLSTY